MLTTNQQLMCLTECVLQLCCYNCKTYKLQSACCKFDDCVVKKTRWYLDNKTLQLQSDTVDPYSIFTPKGFVNNVEELQTLNRHIGDIVEVRNDKRDLYVCVEEKDADTFGHWAKLRGF